MKKGFCKRLHSGALGRYPSGGCIECQRLNRVYYTTPNCRFTFSRRQAKIRGLSWTISKEDFISLFSNPTCYYCGNKFTTCGSGLDRINNSYGYNLNNVIMCCTDCNHHKFDSWTVDEAFVAIQAVKKFRETNVSF